MALNIVVCVKNTPATVNVGVDGATGKLKTQGLTYAMNPFDEYAVEEAVRLKERVPGSTTTALTLGTDSSESVLRDAVSRGIDNGVLVTGFDGDNAYASSFGLAQALKKLHAQNPIHVVLFGKNSSDGNSGVVGAQAAAWLDWPSVTSVKKIDAIDEKSATVWRMMEDGVDVLKAALPVALCTTKEINEPRLPSLKGKMASKKAVIPKWAPADLGVDAAALETLNPSAVLRYGAPPSRPAGMNVEGATAEEKAKKLVDILIERKLIA